MTQLTYPIVPAAPAYAGGLVDSSPHDILSRVNVEGAGIPFGVAVARVSDTTVDLPDATDDVIVGVTCKADHFSAAALSGELGIPDDTVCSVMRQGKVWVIVEDTCVEGGQVFVRHAGSPQFGGFRGADDASDTRLLAGARWGSTQASTGGLAVLILDGLTGATS